MSIEKRITQIIEDTGHSARARVIIEEIITPLCKDAYSEGYKMRHGVLIDLEEATTPNKTKSLTFEQWKQQNLK